MKGNKIKGTLLIAVFIISTIAFALPMVLASPLGSPTLAPDSTGPVGETVTVSGSDASLGGLLEVYWDTTASGNLLNTTYADGAGAYSCEVTIPEDVVDIHYIIARDFSTGDTNASTYEITPKITLDPTSGLPTDEITVSGTGFAGTSDVDVYFGNSTTEMPSIVGLTGNNSMDVDINGSLSYKIVPLFVNITLQTNNTVSPSYDLMVYDNGTGGLYGNITAAVIATGTIAYGTGDFIINITSSADLEVYNATATYLRSLTTAYPADTATTGSLGSFIDASFAVPDVIYANYTVRAIDASQNSSDATFTVTATITLTPEEGPTGITVTVVGDGFTGTGANITFAYEATEEVYVKNNITVTDGAFSESFIVPTVPVGSYTVYVNTTDTSATAEFDVTGTTWIKLTPATGKPGSTVAIEGVNFTATTNIPVTVKFGAIEVDTLYTNATGGFTGTFNVPTLPTDEYTVTATDDNGLNANENFTIAITLIVLDPIIGPTGTNVTIIGYGFGGVANVTFGDTLVSMNEPDIGSGATFIVPTVPVGDYTVTVEDAQDLTSSATFTVNATTEIIVTPDSAPLGYDVTIVGNYFSGGSSITVDLYNDTHLETLGPFTTDADGSFEETFNVTDIDLGNYFINATDTELFPGDLELITVQDVPFSLVEAYRDIHTLSTEYDPGDTVSFYVKSTFEFNLTLNIKDPTNYPYTTITVLTIEWELMDDWYVVPYDKASFNLPSDAITGSWNWTAFDDTVEVANGTFTVGEVVEPHPELPAETTGEEPLDSNGAPQDSFTLGQMVFASAEITNIGTESQPMLIAVQWMDPDYRTLAPSIFITTLSPGQSFVYAPGLILPTTGYATGTWTATILVYDTWPASGGVTIGEPVTITITVS